MENKRLNHAVMMATSELEKTALNPLKATENEVQLYNQLMEYIKSHDLEAEYYEWYSNDEFVNME